MNPAQIVKQFCRTTAFAWALIALSGALRYFDHYRLSRTVLLVGGGIAVGACVAGLVLLLIEASKGKEAAPDPEAPEPNEALRLAAARFREYEAHHAAKPDPEKAQRNADMAAMCEAAAAGRSPIPMVLHCPNCCVQHIDVPSAGAWTNPPHRSHLCAGCGYVWRPADVPTVGVPNVQTGGADDSPFPPRNSKASPQGGHKWVSSDLGHGEHVCRRCRITDREWIATGLECKP